MPLIACECLHVLKHVCDLLIPVEVIEHNFHNATILWELTIKNICPSMTYLMEGHKLLWAFVLNSL